MGYQALLFCPDEKTARTVTQVLNELEFNVECCTEPFAAVKKLMGTHFDALVVDCDNEQNATLLFKSAHSSTSNQASLAVAVVEGQAGVAKAFRIGANLVLTKPINIEQAKGTLRVARGLLRKSEPGKAAAGAVAPTPAPAAPKPVAAKPVPPLVTSAASPVRPAAPAAVAPARPVAPAPAKPIVTPTWPAQVAAATAASATHEGHEPHPEISASRPAPVAPPAVKAPAAVSQAPKLPVATAPAVPAEAKPVALPAPSFNSGGAASAPAPAREVPPPQISEAPSINSAMVPADAPEIESTSAPSASVASTFTFGGANVQPESSGGSKKILIGVAAAVIVAAGLYVAWSHFQGSASQPASSPITTSAPIAAPQPAKPVSAQPKPATSAPSTPPAAPSSQNVADASVQPADGEVVSESAPDKSAATNSGKLSGSAAKPAGKSEAGPLVVKAGSAPAMHAKPAPVADAPAPNMTIAMPGSGGPPANLVSGSTDTAVKPILQTVNISQGVSQGLLIKKVQPQYPRNALNLHVEGPVELMATVSKTGEISHLKVLSGEPLLKGAAVDAVKQWKYKPYLLNGEPVEIQTQITINFKLPH